MSAEKTSAATEEWRINLSLGAVAKRSMLSISKATTAPSKRPRPGTLNSISKRRSPLRASFSHSSVCSISSPIIAKSRRS